MSIAVPLPDDEFLPKVCCPKCGSDLFAQSDGSCLTADIAHDGETVAEAMTKLDALLKEAMAGHYRYLRLIVGGGLIRDEVEGYLRYLQAEGRVLGFDGEGRNRGAWKVRVRA